MPWLLRVVLACLLAWLAGMAAPAMGSAAAPLGLDEAAALASVQQPALDALAARARAAREEAIAARALPDPEIGVGVTDLPATGTDAWSLTRDSDTQVMFEIAQRFPRAEKRRLRGAIEAQEADRLDAERAATARALRREVRLAWLDVWLAERALALRQRTLRDAAAQRDAVAIAQGTGTATLADHLAATVEVGRLQDAIEGTAADVARARIALARWIGDAAQRTLPDGDRLPPAPPLPTATEAVTRIRTHPHLDAMAQMAAVAGTSVAAARAEYAPDYRVALAWGHRPGFSEMVSLEVSADLPLFRRDRQDRRVAAALAREDAANAELVDALRRHAAEVQMHVSDAERLRARLAIHDATLLPQAAARVDAALVAWSANRGALRDVLDARRSVLDVAQARLELDVELARRIVELTWHGVLDDAVAGAGSAGATRPTASAATGGVALHGAMAGDGAAASAATDAVTDLAVGWHAAERPATRWRAVTRPSPPAETGSAPRRARATPLASLAPRPEAAR